VCSLYDSDATQEWYSPAHSPPNHSYTPTGEHLADELTSDYDEYADSYWQYEQDRNRSYGRRLPAPPSDVIDDSVSQRNGYHRGADDDKESFAALDRCYQNGYSNVDSGYSRYDGYYDDPDSYYDSVDHYPEDSGRQDQYYDDGPYMYDNEPMSVSEQHYGSAVDTQLARSAAPYYEEYDDGQRQYIDNSNQSYSSAKEQYNDMRQQYFDGSNQPYSSAKELQYANSSTIPYSEMQQQGHVAGKDQPYLVEPYVGAAGQLYADQQQANRWRDQGQGEPISVDSSMPLTANKCFTDTQRPYAQNGEHPRDIGASYDDQYGMSRDPDDALYDDGYVDKDGVYHRYDDDRYCSGSSRYVDSVPSFEACESELQKSSFENDRDQMAYDRYYEAKRGDSFESYDRESVGQSFVGSVSDTAPLNLKDSGYQTYDRRLSVGFQSAQSPRYFDNQAPYSNGWTGAEVADEKRNMPTQAANEQYRLIEHGMPTADNYPETVTDPLDVDHIQFPGQPIVSISEPHRQTSSPLPVVGPHDVAALMSLNETTTNIGYCSLS